MKGITIILHDLMEYLNECPHDYDYGSLTITHKLDNGYSNGIIEIHYDDICGNHYAVGSVYREDNEHAFE